MRNPISPQVLKMTVIETPLGMMRAIADEKAVHFLAFVDWVRLDQLVNRLRLKTTEIVQGVTDPLRFLQQELKAYFEGTLRRFQTPFDPLLGTPFQHQAWEALQAIPYGETRSYLTQATAIGKPSAYRAVANANGVNPLAIVIPCHRIINHDGRLGGYGGGLPRKEWLITHEKVHREKS